jgi:hypothetical protein
VVVVGWGISDRWRDKKLKKKTESEGKEPGVDGGESKRGCKCYFSFSAGAEGVEQPQGNPSIGNIPYESL